MTGRSAGSVTCHIRRQRLAPSMAAASYRSGLTEASAARKTMIPQPASFHTLCAVIRNLKVSGSVIRPIPSYPCSRRIWESSPAPPNSCWKTAMTSTQEKKCGR
ncbi:hypothetical protein SHKM778_21430 [Streptomyces sp. KM77-8]|uniref:Uncharacterized protein n=1 Tax=Streptomyces haneummycinicus TaxID=3074435 RepID=A0AAT9HE72_9ACTN